MKLKQAVKKAKEKVVMTIAAVSVAAVQLVASAQSSNVPQITVTPQQFQGASSLITLLGYAMYAAWILAFGLLIYAAFEMRNGVLSEGVKKALGGAFGAAFLLTFGWAILTGAI